jgi:hypothetical protein
METTQPLHARKPNVNLDAPVPRHWFMDNVFATHVANGVNMLFPAGERFFVRSVRHFEDRITDPVLRQKMRGFYAQEGSHAREHDRFNRILDEHGLDASRFLHFYERVAYGLIERVAPAELSLSATAACEHFTALMAENALRLRILDTAHPTMRALLLWHAAEEIEHRDVAFDVLREVNDSYALRVAGMAMAASLLSGFWVLGTATLLAQDREAGAARILRDWRSMRRKQRKAYPDRKPVFSEGIRLYLRREFHPTDAQIDHLAGEYLASVGLT